MYFWRFTIDEPGFFCVILSSLERFQNRTVTAEVTREVGMRVYLFDIEANGRRRDVTGPRIGQWLAVSCRYVFVATSAEALAIFRDPTDVAIGPEELTSFYEWVRQTLFPDGEETVLAIGTLRPLLPHNVIGVDSWCSASLLGKSGSLLYSTVDGIELVRRALCFTFEGANARRYCRSLNG